MPPWVSKPGWYRQNLDFSKTQMASVNFETSYAYRSQGEETLQVLSSTDCGVTFDTLLF